MNDTIVIIKEAGKGWTVIVGGSRYAESLVDDECLGVVASTIYAGKTPYVRTPREYAEILKRQTKSAADESPFDFDIKA
ncbi:MAG: hypothetical protein P4L67_04710 [Candidatus Pacebacteria bacterium]|nr:hypothetical protein [Candidatus Paceibacterota bacterium]